ncbi:hypothetical protein SAMN05444170_6807 [Bradyrhizobium erythrophlei]|uniref:Uncharacterized protein n=1 Tax=Bradyrhizobium erythrophlei TaxID=1437360 RepID=A0A1M7UUY7_9BRAD|nr:hypothetical protein SAMN05444170_6807 [Bradyrhizobium erythrophlei]
MAMSAWPDRRLGRRQQSEIKVVSFKRGDWERKLVERGEAIR